MADTATPLDRNMSIHNQPANINERLETRVNYRSFITCLHISKPELIKPEDERLLCRLDKCNKLFKNVRTPREGVLDAIALKTISSFTRIQTIAIDNKPSIKDAFKLMRKCAKIIKQNSHGNEDAFTEFYTNFCPCHNAVSVMNFMSGRMPTYLFERRRLENSFRKDRSCRTRNTVDLSQRTQIEEIKILSKGGEQTSKEILRMNRLLEEAYAKNNNEPVSFFMFTIHPTLFSRSVENIFHISFLIKEGRVELFLDDNQLPVLRPLYKSNEPNDCKASPATGSISKNKGKQMESLTQLILSLDIEQWENLVEVFHIQTAMI